MYQRMVIHFCSCCASSWVPWQQRTLYWFPSTCGSKIKLYPRVGQSERERDDDDALMDCLYHLRESSYQVSEHVTTGGSGFLNRQEYWHCHPFTMIEFNLLLLSKFSV